MNQQAGGKKTQFAISPIRSEDYPQWYQSIVKHAEMAEMSDVRGCMIIRPWGYGIWEQIRKHLNQMIEDTGHENAYFPLFIPLSYIEKEAAHVDGFAKEMAVVTHHRLEKKDGKLVPASPLNEPMVIRPTSETVIGESFSRWINSYRDLPLLINQWANVVRWEMRPRIFLRTTEFLWQEGHTAHATEADAMVETMKMLEVYRVFAEEFLAIPVLVGEKPESERFPGADRTYCIEAMMQDGKALQAGTSHYLGQNFAKASNIQFLDNASQRVYAYTTSWGVSTRLIGALIMTHADDDGMRVPPKIAPKQIVVLPFERKGSEEQTRAYAQKITADLRKQTFADGTPIVAHCDLRDVKSVDKKWQWIKRGAPLIVEVGPRDMEGDKVSLIRRDGDVRQAAILDRQSFINDAGKLLDEVQANYLNTARKLLSEGMRTDVKDFAQFEKIFAKSDDQDSKAKLPFVKAKWCGNYSCQEKAEKFAVTIRCLPLVQDGSSGACVICSQAAKTDAVFAKSY